MKLLGKDLIVKKIVAVTKKQQVITPTNFPFCFVGIERECKCCALSILFCACVECSSRVLVTRVATMSVGYRPHAHKGHVFWL